MINRVCIYCAASPLVDQVYLDATEKLGALLVEEGIEVVFGGGSEGLMGKLADTVLAKGGKIKGIMPQFMDEVEWGHEGVTNFEFTKTMHERKAKFLIDIDGIIALPGGTGTLEELLEVMTLKRLRIFTKPIAIINTNNYYDPLKSMLKKCVDEKFMNPQHLRMWTFVDQAEEALMALKSTVEPL